MRIRGLDGDSTCTKRVFSVIAHLTASKLVVSTNFVTTPQRDDTLVSKRYIPVDIEPVRQLVIEGELRTAIKIATSNDLLTRLLYREEQRESTTGESVA